MLETSSRLASLMRRPYDSWQALRLACAGKRQMAQDKPTRAIIE
jgi:hypothetical protein